MNESMRSKLLLFVAAAIKASINFSIYRLLVFNVFVFLEVKILFISVLILPKGSLESMREIILS